MSMVRIAFFFDYKSFLVRIAPALEALKNGDSSNLRMLAGEIGTTDRRVWKILDYYDISPEDDDFKERNYGNIDKRIVFWLVLVMSAYCSIIDDPLDPRTIGKLLEPAKDEEILSMLASGKPFSSMFSALDPSITKSEPVDYILRAIDHYPAGWLSIEDIENIRTKLQVSSIQGDSSAYARLMTVLDATTQLKQGLIFGMAI